LAAKAVVAEAQLRHAHRATEAASKPAAAVGLRSRRPSKSSSDGGVRGALDDRAALTVFYYATGGSGWARQDRWLSERPVGTWHGVTANR
jgi:hypothetical protein